MRLQLLLQNLADVAADNPSLRDFTCYVLIAKEKISREAALTESSMNGSTSTNTSGLALRLFFIFTNTKQPFPNASLERCRVSTKERYLLAIRPCLVAPLPDVRVELGMPSVQEVNYLGWDARPQRPIADFLVQQKQRWRDRLRSIVSHAAAGAHKDYLWKRLFGALLGELSSTMSPLRLLEINLVSFFSGVQSVSQPSGPFEASVGTLPTTSSSASLTMPYFASGIAMSSMQIETPASVAEP